MRSRTDLTVQFVAGHVIRVRIINNISLTLSQRYLRSFHKMALTFHLLDPPFGFGNMPLCHVIRVRIINNIGTTLSQRSVHKMASTFHLVSLLLSMICHFAKFAFPSVTAKKCEHSSPLSKAKNSRGALLQKDFSICSCQVSMVLRCTFIEPLWWIKLLPDNLRWLLFNSSP